MPPSRDPFRTHEFKWDYTAQNIQDQPTFAVEGGNYVSYKSEWVTRDMTLDGWNRVVKSSARNVFPGEPESEVAYRYDALGRMIGETTQRTFIQEVIEERPRGFKVKRERVTVVTTQELYHSLAGQVLHEAILDPKSNAFVPYRDNVFSLAYLDALAMVDDIYRGKGRLYPLQDANWNVTALVVNEGGQWKVGERYVYDPYGLVSFLKPDWSNYGRGDNVASKYDWQYLHQGGRLNLGDRLYHFGARKLDPILGRWMQQDPSGYVDGMNLYEYVGSNPVNRVDPSGRAFFLPALAVAVVGGLYVHSTMKDIEGFKKAGMSTDDAAFVSALSNFPIGLSSAYSAFEFAEGRSLRGSTLGQPLTGWGYTLRGIGIAADVLMLGIAARGFMGSAAQASRVASGAEVALSRTAQLRQLLGQRYTDYLRYRGQGYSAFEAFSLMRPYTGVGHHFIQKAFINRLIARCGSESTLMGRTLAWYRESMFNVLRGRNMTFGEFYELHARLHGLPAFGRRSFQGAHLPGGGAWAAANVTPPLIPFGPLGYIWHGSPLALKLAVGGIGGTGTGATIAAYYL